MWEFQIKATDQGVDQTLQLSQSKLYLYPALKYPSPGFLMQAIGVNTDEWHQAGPKDTFSNEKVQFLLRTSNAAADGGLTSAQANEIANKAESRSFIAFQVLLKDNLAFLSQPQRDEFAVNQKNLLSRIEDRFLNSSLKDDPEKLINASRAEIHCGSRMDIHFGARTPFIEDRKFFELKKEWNAAFNAWTTNYVGHFVLHSQRRDEMPCLRNWEPLKLHKTMAEVLATKIVDNESLLWHRVHNQTELNRTPGQIQKIMRNVLGSDDWKAIDAVFETHRSLGERTRIPFPSIDPKSVKVANDAKVEFLKETAGGIGSQPSSFDGDPYKSDPRHALSHGYRQKKFDPK